MWFITYWNRVEINASALLQARRSKDLCAVVRGAPPVNVTAENVTLGGDTRKHVKIQQEVRNIIGGNRGDKQ